jgi:hypothetical protein
MAIDLTRNARTQAQPCVPCCPPTGNPSTLGCCAAYTMPEKLTVSLFGYENAGWPTPASTSALDIPQYALADFTIQDKVFDITLTENMDTSNAFYKKGYGSFARPGRYAYVVEDLPISINCNLKPTYTYSSIAPDINYVLSYDDSAGPFYMDFGVFCGPLTSGSTGTQWAFTIKTQPSWSPYGSGIGPYNFYRVFFSGLIALTEPSVSAILMNCSPFAGYSSMKPSYPFLNETSEVTNRSLDTALAANAGYIGGWVTTQTFGVSTNTYLTYYRPAGTMKAIITE